MANMAQASTESVVEHEPEPTPIALSLTSSPTDHVPTLKGRKRLLKHLQRMTSSQSLSRFSKSSDATYRPGARGSISCMTLGSASSHYTPFVNLEEEVLQVGFPTAPGSAFGTPILDTPYIDVSESGRFMVLDGGSSYRTPISGPMTADPSLTSGMDYFSRPFTQSQQRKPRPDFNFWGEIPGEIQTHILSFLGPKELVRCSAVSRSWNKMCFDGQLWANFDTADYYTKIPADTLSRIATNAGPFVRDLNLRGCIQLWDSWARSGLPDACRNLENLSLQDCRVDRSSMHLLINRNSRLVHLNLTRLTAVYNSTMRIIAKNCPKLELLNVNWCSNVDTRGLRNIIEGCPNLRDLRAGEVRGFDDIEFMTELFNRNTLERLLIPNCETLTDEGLTAFIEGVDAEMDYITRRRIVAPRKLKHLDISRCRNVSDDGIRSMIGNMPELEGLQLTRCKALTDHSIKPLVSNLPSLTHLDLEELEELTNATFQELARSPCKETLQHLCISYCENVGDAGMLPVIKNCVHLQNLDLDNTRISDLCLAEAAAMVRQRCTRSPPLLHRAITWDGMTAAQRRGSTLGSGPAKPKISLKMAVYDCQNVTWTGIREVLSRNTEIRRPVPFSLSLPSLPTTDDTETPVSFPLDLTFALPALPSYVDPARFTAPPSHPTQIISLKVFYGYQPTVTEHTRRVLRGDFASASRLERKWAEYMVASEEAGAAIGVGTGNGHGNANALVAGFGTVGNRRRRRRVREAQMMHADEEEGGIGGTGVGRRRRARSGGACAVM